MQKTRTTFHTRLLKSFPPPSFLDVPTAGIDISDCSVKVMALRNTEQGLVPAFFEEQKIPTGTVADGAIENPDALIEVLAALRRKYNLSLVRVSLPEEKAYLFQTTVPRAADRAQMLTHIEFRLEENVPIPPKDAIFDYDIISESDSAADVSVTVFPAATIESYRAMLRKSGLTPLSLELEGQAIANAVIPREDARTHLIVDFGRSRTGIAVVKNGVVGFTSTIDIGGNALTEAVMKHFGVGEAEAQKIKNEQGFAQDEKNKELHDSLMSTIAALKDEINRLITYWNGTEVARGGGDTIATIILCGGNASLAGLPEFLTKSLRVPVERANVWTNAFSLDEYVPPVSFPQSLSYATVIGLALQ